MLNYNPKVDAKLLGRQKYMTKLGKKAAKSLQTLKVPEADFVFSSTIPDLEVLVGCFENSFHGANYEKTYKIAEAQKGFGKEE